MSLDVIHSYINGSLRMRPGFHETLMKDHKRTPLCAYTYECLWFPKDTAQKQDGRRYSYEVLLIYGNGNRL